MTIVGCERGMDRGGSETESTMATGSRLECLLCNFKWINRTTSHLVGYQSAVSCRILVDFFFFFFASLDVKKSTERRTMRSDCVLLWMTESKCAKLLTPRNEVGNSFLIAVGCEWFPKKSLYKIPFQ